MTAKELVKKIIVDRVETLETEIKGLKETLAEKERELTLTRLAGFLMSEDKED